MKLFSNTLIVLLFAIFSFQANAQEEDLSQRNIASGTTIYTTNSNDFTGSPLLKKSFEDGSVLFTSGKVSEVVPLNYDSHKNQVLFIDGNDIRVLSLAGIKGFVFEKTDDKEKVQERFTLGINVPGKDINKRTPIQLFYNGKTKLLAHHSTHLMKGNSRDPFTGKVTDRYISDIKYYLQKPNGEFVETKMRIKNIIRDLGKEHRKELNAYAKDNKLDKRSEKDIVQLLEYYDEIN